MLLMKIHEKRLQHSHLSPINTNSNQKLLPAQITYLAIMSSKISSIAKHVQNPFLPGDLYAAQKPNEKYSNQFN